MDHSAPKTGLENIAQAEILRFLTRNLAICLPQRVLFGVNIWSAKSPIISWITTPVSPKNGSENAAEMVSYIVGRRSGPGALLIRLLGSIIGMSWGRDLGLLLVLCLPDG